MGSDRSEKFGLLHRIDAEIGFKVKVHIQHFGRISGLLTDLSDLGLIRLDDGDEP